MEFEAFLKLLHEMQNSEYLTKQESSSPKKSGYGFASEFLTSEGLNKIFRSTG